LLVSQFLKTFYLAEVKLLWHRNP